MNLPQGFVLDEPKKSEPNLPQGFVLDSQPQQPAQTAPQQDFSQLPEFGSSEGLSALFGDGEGVLDGQLGGDTVGAGQLFRDAAAQAFTFDGNARVDGIEKRFPELQVERIGDGDNAIITNPNNGKQAIVNQKGFSPQDFQQIVGGIGAFAPAGKLVGAAKGVLGKAATAAVGSGATDAVLQGAEHIQGSDQDFNTTRTALSAGLGGALQGAGSKIAQSLENGAVKSLVSKAAPAIDELKDRATQLYNQVDQLGVTLKPESYQGLLSKLNKTAENFGFVPEIQSNTSAALNALAKREGQAPTFSDLNNLRKVLGNAAQSTEKSDAALASQLIGTLDRTLDNLPNSAISGQGASAKQASGLLKEARGEVAKRKRAETIELAITNGQNAASGAENGIRGNLRTLLNRINSGKENGFPPEVVAQIQKVVDGGDGANLAKLLGKGAFNPSGNNFLGGTIGAGAAGALGGTPAIIAQQAISGGSKRLAQNITTNNAKLASAIARSGGNSIELARAYIKTVPKSQRTPEGLAEIIKSQGASADDLLARAENLGGENKQTIIDAAKLLLAENAAN